MGSTLNYETMTEDERADWRRYYRRGLSPDIIAAAFTAGDRKRWQRLSRLQAAVELKESGYSDADVQRAVNPNFKPDEQHLVNWVGRAKESAAAIEDAIDWDAVALEVQQLAAATREIERLVRQSFRLG